MTPDAVIALLRRGRCTAAKLAEAGCVTCEATDEAIRCLVAEGALRAHDDGLPPAGRGRLRPDRARGAAVSEPVNVYIAAPSAANVRPRVREFFAAVAAIPGCRVSHDWPAAMDAHGDAHMAEHTLHTEALLDVAGVERARVLVMLTADTSIYDTGPATSGGALLEMGVALARRRLGHGPVIVQSGQTWPHPCFGALVDHRFMSDAETLAWLRGFACQSVPVTFTTGSQP